ncbi:hypothetical protein A5886_001989 [Enterococcus sp. 8G7_MSG3316]|uniref:Voltage-gated chloride channel family protein n=1 Tax=Candidatus Enterococcus testudinis TaxID=1834191 RepID=A0A242A7P7_9ENTE|nr:chloride channel protein [Enterococcus sp. 8G7_MSG3316]OTN76910.1 hypothetical protein A5886_001989 [Enterococcus sp. 8G7_MSG3316]
MAKQWINYREFLILSIISLSIGVVVGLLDACFGEILLFLTSIRMAHFFYLIPFLPFAGLLFVYYFQKYGQKSTQGMNLVFLAGHEKEREIPLRMIPFVMIGTWVTHLFGGSAGREGVAVQLGATIANRFGAWLKLEKYNQTLIIIGMAAGFAGLFETPLAATFFALEVLVVGKLFHHALFPALLAAFTASTVSQWAGLEKFSIAISGTFDFTIAVFLKLLLLGLIFGLTGAAFAFLLAQLKHRIQKWFPNALRRIFIGSAGLAILLVLLYQGRYAGLGTNLIAAAFADQQIYTYDWLLKMLLTVLTISIGFLGGEVTPLFAIGTTLGAVLAPIFGLPIELVAALGYASVFGSATNTVFAPIFIGGEVFGFQTIPYFAVVCSVAYFCSGKNSIYALQKNQDLRYHRSNE